MVSSTLACLQRYHSKLLLCASKRVFVCEQGEPTEAAPPPPPPAAASSASADDDDRNDDDEETYDPNHSVEETEEVAL